MIMEQMNLYSHPIISYAPPSFCNVSIRASIKPLLGVRGHCVSAREGEREWTRGAKLWDFESDIMVGGTTEEWQHKELAALSRGR
jgi:hypothetical protein